MHLHGLYWSEFRQVKNCLLTVWPTTPQPFTQILAENSAVRSCQSFCGPFSGFSRTRHSVSIVKLSWHRVFLVLDKKRKTTSIFCEKGYNRKGLGKIRFSTFGASTICCCIWGSRAASKVAKICGATVMSDNQSESTRRIKSSTPRTQKLEGSVPENLIRVKDQSTE